MIVVTGAKGFLGKNLMYEFKSKGISAYGLGRENGDLREFKTCKKLLSDAETVVHLAASVGGIDFLRTYQARSFYENILIGSNIVQACKENSVKRLIIIGTACSYPAGAKIPLSEEYIYNGLPSGETAPYGLAKAAISLIANEILLSNGQDVVTLIPTNLYGPNDSYDINRSHVVASLIRKCFVCSKIGKKEVEIWGDGTATRDFLYIGDAARAIRMIICYSQQYNGEIYNIASGVEVCIKELAQIVVEAIDPHLSLRFKLDGPVGAQRRSLNISKIENWVGFHPSISLIEGIKRTVDWIDLNSIWKKWLNEENIN